MPLDVFVIFFSFDLCVRVFLEYLFIEAGSETNKSEYAWYMYHIGK